MIHVPLAKAPWLRFQAGSKTVEIRNVASPVAAQVRKAFNGDAVLLVNGYNAKNGALKRQLGRVATAHGFASLPEWAIQGADLHQLANNFFDLDAHLVAFEALPDPHGELNSDEQPPVRDDSGGTGTLRET